MPAGLHITINGITPSDGSRSVWPDETEYGTCMTTTIAAEAPQTVDAPYVVTVQLTGFDDACVCKITGCCDKEQPGLCLQPCSGDEDAVDAACCAASSSCPSSTERAPAVASGSSAGGNLDTMPQANQLMKPHAQRRAKYNLGYVRLVLGVAGNAAWKESAYITLYASTDPDGKIVQTSKLLAMTLCMCLWATITPTG